MSHNADNMTGIACVSNILIKFQCKGTNVREKIVYFDKSDEKLNFPVVVVRLFYPGAKAE